MQEFYRIPESSAALTKLEALREAQLRFLHGEQPALRDHTGDHADRGVALAGHTGATDQGIRGYAHPYYWASFFLMGNWL